MKTVSRLVLPGILILAMNNHGLAATSQLLGWNNLGMHCMDSDYSVFSVLPPYNTIECQLIVNGALVTNGAGYTVTYQAVADPSGSINSTAMGKGNYYTYAKALFGATLPPEAGLAGWSMPGVSNIPQGMLFEQTNQPAGGVFTGVNWFRAEGIPISPYDDALKKNPYPLMRMVARNPANQPIATNDIVLPVSDEMDCRACHASGTQAAAKPAAGWIWDGLPERDFRLNILRLHDERHFATNAAFYREALAARGFNGQGLLRGVLADGKPVLCAACHASEALGAPSYGTIPPLTASVHSFHAHVQDPILNTTLDNSANRAACYRCHPGSTTRCLRGAMGGAIASDGSMEMQCQSCHGNMSAVGSANRVGWFMEPTCQSCHSGTATHNNGAIRYTSVFETNGLPREPMDTTFATTSDTPATSLSLYRFSVGHGGLQCSACHGSTHAEFPSTHASDNLRNRAIQGHAGVMVECTACHVSMPVSSSTATNGPHGMHPVGQSWVSAHHDYIGGNLGKCQACHGADNRGTVLSRAQGDRILTASFDGGTVTLNLFRGAMIGCYTCHNGPGNDSINNSAPPTVSAVGGGTRNDTPLSMTVAMNPPAATLRIISQPANGSIGVSSNVLTYFANPGFTGDDTFTYAAWDGAKNSTLATGRVSVAQGPVSIQAVAHVPASYSAAWPVPFVVVPIVSNSLAITSFDWDFGDGTAHDTNQYPSHAYGLPGSYGWSVTATVGGSSARTSSTILIGAPVFATIARVGNAAMVSWPETMAYTLLQANSDPSSAAGWTNMTNEPSSGGGSLNVTLQATGGQFFRVRRPW
ncbi:MAG TPA: PKD domain-containing protein [Candidatus Dormibacteraeota bacterium]|nr:PKD domain-containing protein [Candidatus Dormibacteraeota bacterium]